MMKSERLVELQAIAGVVSESRKILGKTEDIDCIHEMLEEIERARNSEGNLHVENWKLRKIASNLPHDMILDACKVLDAPVSREQTCTEQLRQMFDTLRKCKASALLAKQHHNGEVSDE